MSEADKLPTDVEAKLDEEVNDFKKEEEEETQQPEALPPKQEEKKHESVEIPPVNLIEVK
mgnify:CR=1 FL=1